eukprot:15464840-Alexandrium_andersonii.AAC.1
MPVGSVCVCVCVCVCARACARAHAGVCVHVFARACASGHSVPRSVEEHRYNDCKCEDAVGMMAMVVVAVAMQIASAGFASGFARQRST